MKYSNRSKCFCDIAIMGEIVEITTVPKQQHIFYKITSGALRFQVRGLCNAGISLARKPSRASEFWIIIGRQGSTVVVKGGDEVLSVPTPQIMSSREFKEFWIQWYDNVIVLGRRDSDIPFLVHREDTFGLNYITFAAIGQNTYGLQWRFEVPPLLEKVGLKAISSGVPEWKQADDQLPDGAFIGGYEKEMLYIIRARHQGSLTPGKFVPSEGLGYISWGGSMHEKDDFEVLCGFDCVWIPCSNGSVPAGAVEGGYSEVTRETLFVGRALYKNCLIPGKVQPSHNVCYIPYEEREIAVKNYEILVVPEKNMQCANPLFMYDIKLYETPTENTHVEAYVDSEDSD